MNPGLRPRGARPAFASFLLFTAPLVLACDPGASSGRSSACPARAAACPGLVETAPEPWGANCPEGGLAVRTGRDLNLDGVLSEEEVVAVSYVCNGTPGGDGTTPDVSVAPATPEQCPHGGSVITIDGSERIVCDGEPGEDGRSPTLAVRAATAAECPEGGTVVTVNAIDSVICNGLHGEDGATPTVGFGPAPESVCPAGGVTLTIEGAETHVCHGLDGEDGVSPTLSIVAAGEDACPYGGTLFRVDNHETAVCNGEPGPEGAAARAPHVSVTAATEAQCENGGTVIAIDTLISIVCNGTDGAAGPAGEPGVSPTVSVTPATAEQCRHGGAVLTVNGVSSAVCNGEPGPEGASPLVSMTPATSEQCPHGGTVLAINAQQAFLCNGAEGQPGRSSVITFTAATFDQCPNGGVILAVEGVPDSDTVLCDGEPGPDGHTALVAETLDPTPTDACPYGVRTITLGVDDGAGAGAIADDGVLQGGEVRSRFELCEMAPATYTVTYDVEGGTPCDPATRSVALGQAYGALCTPTRAGYAFDGWWTGDGGTGSLVSEGTNVGTAGNHILYARWQLITPEVSFTYTGSAQTWTVPEGVTSIQVDLRGAQGGGCGWNGSPLGSGIAPGGLGGRVTASLPVTSGETLFIYVGGQGGTRTVAQCGEADAPRGAGWNGGGNGNRCGGGGGGASDIRRGGTDLAHRIAVAGGGGGASGGSASCATYEGHPGGNGGGLVGSPGSTGCVLEAFVPGSPGGQSAGGSGGSSSCMTGGSGSLGQGGHGVGGYSCGGGGGYYGGGASGSGCHGGTASAGGGSSLIPAGGQTESGFQTGNGHVVISYIPSTSTVTYDSEAGSVCSPATKTVTLGQAYGALCTPTRAGYTFTGWWTGDNGTGTRVTATTTVGNAANHTVHAGWAQNGTAAAWLADKAAGWCSKQFNSRINVCGNVTYCGDGYFMRSYPDGIALDIGFYWDGSDTGHLVNFGRDMPGQALNVSVSSAGQITAGGPSGAVHLNATLAPGRRLVSYHVRPGHHALYVDGVLVASGTGATSTVNVGSGIAGGGPGFTIGSRLSEETPPGPDAWLRFAPFFFHMRDISPSSAQWSLQEATTTQARSLVYFDASGVSGTSWSSAVGGRTAVSQAGATWTSDYSQGCFP
jgi:uncharacterized repeat protein (TIGR02543 family)